MSKRSRCVSVLLAMSQAVLFVGCQGSPPTREELAAAEFGPAPTNPAPAIRAHFDGVLKDPESGRYKLGQPQKGYFGKTLSNLAGPRNIVFAWLVPTLVNAKNSYGGYTGDHLYHCWFRGESLIAVVEYEKVMHQVEASAALTAEQLSLLKQ